MLIARQRPWFMGGFAAVWASGGLIIANGALGHSFVWPLAFFGVWSTTLALAMLLVLDNEGTLRNPIRGAGRALLFGLLLVAASLLFALLLQFWLVVLTLASLFAVCRSIAAEDAPAY